ncbi:MAG TPA: hypothetical protein VNX68_13910 [Nitrosopumilaceae archaeon]|jgi:hypothetical protein|nr:hypothetical protein [Nitrosopumilaceae archaeon]
MAKSFLMECGEVGNLGLKQLTETRQIVTNKWEKLGLLDGLAGVLKENIAQLYENQLSQMINESSDSSVSGQFETVAFPVIRRVFSKLLANEIVSVQALNLPIGKLFYINPKVSLRNTDGSHTSYDGAYSNAARLAASATTQFDTVSLYDAYYATGVNDEGTGLFDRSKGAYTLTTGTTQLVTGSTLTATGSSINSITSAYITAIIPGFTALAGTVGKLTGPVGHPMDTEEFLASLTIIPTVKLFATDVVDGSYDVAASAPIPFNVKVQKYGQPMVDANGNLVILIDASYGGTDGYKALSASSTGLSFTYSFKTYSDLEEDSEMAEVTFSLDEVTVDVTTRKMRALWTPELAMDVSAFHNIDAEAELTALLSEQMAAEIDREILRDLRRGAAWTTRHDNNGWMKRTHGYYGVKKDYNQELMTKINQISAQIHKSTLRGGASWIVVSPEVSAIFDDLEYFHVSNASPEQDKYNMGIEKVGTLQGRYTVYRDPYAPASSILIGHKGNSILEAGYIYAPYVPMQLTAAMQDPRDFKNVRGIITRYAKKMILNRYYGKITVDGIQTFGIGDLK